MLNYIWLALIAVGISVAVWSDLHDLSSNTYHNGEAVEASIVADSISPGGEEPTHSCLIRVAPGDFNRVYGTSMADTIILNADRLAAAAGGAGFSGWLHIRPDRLPKPWGEIFTLQKNPDFLLARYTYRGPASSGRITIVLEPVKFVRLNAVTNDGLIRYAKIAVELAIGLIGIMALWLGLMKIAEQSGLIGMLASLLKPATTRLFPDVPPDHPAMGAMIMNISANILGLANAATPLGLKAMEELNKLNRKTGVATDAMCTFLVINTSSVQLIPSTVIALRAAAGSSNPTEIIGPVIVATTVNTIVGVIAVKLLARLRVFRKQLES
jgi:spore maturation protein A